MNTFFTKDRLVLSLFTSGYIVASSIWFIAQRNYEFIWYVATMLVIVGILLATYRASQLPNPLLWLLSIWGLLHVLGGGIFIDGHSLYAQILYPFHVDGDFTILKYDQVVHAYGFAVAALVLHNILSRLAPTMGVFGRIMFPALGSMGLSVVNEIIEFIAALSLPNTWVGGYYNLSLDLVANTIGAFGAVIIFEIIRSFRKNF